MVEGQGLRLSDHFVFHISPACPAPELYRPGLCTVFKVLAHLYLLQVNYCLPIALFLEDSHLSWPFLLPEIWADSMNNLIQ